MEDYTSPCWTEKDHEATEPDFATEKSSAELGGWATYGVIVTQNGEDILNMSTHGIEGVKNIEDHTDGIRHCAAILLSFIGE